jgi:hypothetical protein
MKAMGRFPAFCNETNESDLENSCKVELATMLSHLKGSSVDLQYTANISCSTGTALGSDCDYAYDSTVFPPTSGQQYFGRGPFMLSNNINYGQLSNSIYKGLDAKNQLLDNPSLVALDGELAFTSAFWYYMFPQAPRPSMHDAILGFFEPSEFDLEQDICTGCFGTTTNIISRWTCSGE